jgi:hypothetical protein
LDGVFDLGLAALTDTLSTANALAGSLEQPPAPIEVTLVGVRRRVRTAQGLTVPVVPVHGVQNPDVVLMPALGAKMPDTLAARLACADVADAVVAVLERAIAEGGTTLNDFTDGAGQEGYFQGSLAVYGRAGEPCAGCGATVRRIVQGGRSSFYCPRCQR